MPGILRSRVGFTGGSTEFPTYRNLADHTETVDFDFDPTVVSYSRLLELFWELHDPTTKTTNQYMSAIFYHNDEQKRLAEESKKAQAKVHSVPITTKILPAKVFYNAEDYHQKYLLRQHRGLVRGLGLSDAELIKSFTACRLNGYVGGYGNLDTFEKDLPLLGLTKEQEDYVRQQILNPDNSVGCSR